MATRVNGFSIAACLETAAAIDADLGRLTASLTEAQFHAPSRVGGWSIGQCVDHLVLTGRAFLPGWDTALREAGAHSGNPGQEFPYGWWQRIALRVVEDPSMLKRKAPPRCTPYTRYSIEETLVRFSGMRQEFTRLVDGARRVDARRTKVMSPFTPWLRYALGFSFDLVLAHERRHLCQAWTARRQTTEASSEVMGGMHETKRIGTHR